MRNVSELPSLLFRQRLFLAALTGAVCSRDVALGIAAFALLLAIPRRTALSRVALQTAFFVVGLGVALLAEPEPPDCPSWASVPGKSVVAEGRVDAVTGLPGGRARVLLKELRPVTNVPELPEEVDAQVRKALKRTPPSGLSGGRKGYPGAIVEDESSPVPGLVTMTLYANDMERIGRPVPGQTMRALLRLYPSVGSVNPGTSDLGSYWADRDVWHNARLTRKNGGPILLSLAEGEGAFFQASRLRERWRGALEKTLLGHDSDEAGADAPQAKNAGMATAGASASEQGRAMLLALLFGDRSRLSPETVELFTRAGLVHSLALSGQHLALAAMAGTAFVAMLSLAFRGLFLRVPRRTLLVSAGVPFAMAYLFLGGAPFSLIRAAFMMLVAAGFLCLRRVSSSLDALLAAAMLLFIGWPLSVFDLSAQLSVLAVAGILLSMPLISALRKRFPPSEKRRAVLPWPRRAAYALIRWIGTMLILSFSAQMAVLPVLASTFGAVSLNFWMNVFWLPPLTFVTLPGAALGLLLLIPFGPQPVSDLLFAVAAWPADVMLSWLSAMARDGWLPYVQCFRPSSLSALGYGAAFAGALLFVGARLSGGVNGVASRRLLLCGLLLLPAGQLPTWVDDWVAAKERRVSLTLFDVGQGQAALLEYPGGRVLVDGGGGASPFFDCGRSILAPALTCRRVPRLDAVLVSHTDMDHARGLRWILEHFDVGCLCWSSISAGDDSADGRALREIARRKGIPEKILARGDTLTLAEGVRLEVVWPDLEILRAMRPGRKTSGNDASLAFLLMRDDKALALLCGDMTAPALRRLAESGQRLRAQMLVLPHHGAASGFQRAFYDAVSPEASMASAASFNHYGFPSAKVRREMARRLIPLFSTTDRGGVTVTWSGRDARMTLPGSTD